MAIAQVAHVFDEEAPCARTNGVGNEEIIASM